MNKKFKILIFIGIILLIYGLLIEPNIITIKHYEIEDAKLKGLKIVFASDFHFRPKQEKKLQKVVNLINGQNPDIFLSVGDFINGQRDKSTMPADKIAEGLGKIQSKYGFYTTLGNHDTYHNKEKVKKSLEKNGIKVLDNENVKINANGKTVYIAGVADMSTDRPMIRTALKDAETPLIFLTHSPDLFPRLTNDINLTLAGHLHGGQVRIPLFGAIYTPSGYGDRYSKGKIIIENGKKMIVTRGVGTSLVHFRFCCPPEIIVINFI